MGLSHIWVSVSKVPFDGSSSFSNAVFGSVVSSLRRLQTLGKAGQKLDSNFWTCHMVASFFGLVFPVKRMIDVCAFALFFNGPAEWRTPYSIHILMM